MVLSFSKPTSLKIFFSVLTVLVLLQCVISQVLPAAAMIVLMVVCVLMLVFVTVNTLRFVCTKSSETLPSETLPSETLPSETPPAETSSRDPVPLLPTTAPRNQLQKSERLYYLDNLKVFLTVLVILHHQTCSFVGNGWYFNVGNYKSSFQAFGNAILVMDQSYFMCMFFFISGYFTPTSLERKGRELFLRNKFKRLGIPYLLFAFFLSPLLGIVYGSFSGHGVKWNPTYNPGPLWFTGWLLVFNYAYACTDHSAPTVMAAPTPLRLLGYTFPLNLLQLALMGLMGGSFAYMPITFGSLPFDIMFFYGGCIAKRNQWLEAETEGGVVEIMGKYRKWIYAVIVVHSVYYISYSMYYQQTHVGSTKDAFEDYLFLGTCLFLGSWLFVALMPFAQLDLFRNHANWTGRWSKVLAGASYTAYIVHPFFVCTATGVFVVTYEAVTGQQLVFKEGRTDSETVLESDAWLWGGWAVCTFASVTLTFFFSYWFRELCPGAKQIL